MAIKKPPFVGLAVLVGSVSAFFLLHVQPRRDHLVELDFQQLADMAERIDIQLANYQQIVANTRPPHRLPPPLEPLGTPARDAASAGPEGLWVTISDRTTPAGRWFEFDGGPVKALLPVDELMRQAWEQHSFDKLILAASDGRILYQDGSADIQLASLAALDLGDMSRLARSSGLEEAEVAGQSYEVFVRPCATPRAATRTGKVPPEGWLLVGLTRTAKLHLSSLQVSANWLIVAFGVALLALLALPFLKLLTLGKGARLRAIDGLLAGLCALIGLSVLTVLLLDQFVHRKLEGKQSRQIQGLAGEIHRFLVAELEGALVDLSELRKTFRPPAISQEAYTVGVEPRTLRNRRDFFWVDRSGRQMVKVTERGRETPPINVARRAYFRDAVEGRLLGLRGTPGTARRFSLEPVRSWTTGEDLAVIAVPARPEDAGAAAAVLTTRLPAVHEPVLPPGFGFAVLDAKGKVLFHSDPRRALQTKSFLRELRSRDLEALAAAERAGEEVVLYRGRQHEVYLEPVPELSWTVLAFRDMTLLRATNVQIVTTAMVCLVLYAALFLALFSFVFVASSTRARWLWPVPSRQGTYLQLAVFYAGCLAVHVVLLRDGHPVFLLFNGMLIPLVVLFASYLKVRLDQGLAERPGRGAPPSPGLLDGKLRGALAVVVVLLTISLAIGVRWLDGWPLLVVLVSLAAGGLLLSHPAASRLFAQWRTAPLRATYLVSAALLLLVLTTLPAASFFKLACDVPIENMLKLAQLKLMRQLDGHLEQGREKETALRYAGIYFATGDPEECADRASAPSPAPIQPHLSWLLRAQEWMFPIYSENSQGLARLALDEAGEWQWHWRHQAARLQLHREEVAGRTALHLESSFPRIKPLGLDWLFLGLGALLLGLISFGLVWLMAHNLMLLGTGPPLWLNRRRLCLGASAGHVIYVSRTPERLRTPALPGAAVVDFAAMEEKVEAGKALERPAFANRRLVVVRGFEHRLEDRSFNWAKLELLEALVAEGGRRLVVLSSEDPYLCLAAGVLLERGDDAEREEEEGRRWRSLLTHFAVVDLDGRPQDAQGLTEEIQQKERDLFLAGGHESRLERVPWKRHVEGCLRLVREELSPTARLQEIGMDLLPDLDLEDTSQVDLMREILTRAEGYYADLWASLPDDEKLVLVQLAEEGLANPRDLRPLQRLVARGIVLRDPAPRLMNETFRLFVSGAAVREKVHQLEAELERESTWGQVRVPIMAGLVGCVLFFGATQQEALKTTLTLITMVTGVLPQLLQLVGFIGTKAPLPPGR